MKRTYLPPLALLAAMFLLALVNSAYTIRETDRWRSQLSQASDLARAEDWPGAEAELTASYTDWLRQQTYLHLVLRHDTLDEAEIMYRRAAAFAAGEDTAEFLAETEELRQQLALIAEMERLSLRNIF